MWLGLVAALLVLCVPRITWSAEPQRTVAVVRTAGPIELTKRLREEMMTLGWSVVEIAPPGAAGGAPTVDIREVTETISGSAGVLVREHDVVLWIQPASRQGDAGAETVPFAVDTDASIAAMQLVELLRARLIAAGFALGTEHPPPRPSGASAADSSTETPANAAQGDATSAHAQSAEATKTPAASSEEAATYDSSRLWLGAGPSLGWSAGGVPPMPQLWLAGSLRGRGRLALSLDFGVPLAGSTVSEGDARATVRTAVGLVGVHYVAVERAHTARLSFGGAAGVLLVHVAGAAPAPAKASSTWIPTAAFAARARYRHPLSDRFMISSEVLAGVATPRPVVRFFDDVVASWGQPFAFLTLAVETRAF